MMNQSSPPAMVAAVYGALFIALGIYLPFFPLLLAARGLNDPQIAIVIAAPMAVRALAAAPLGLLADRIGDRRLVLLGYTGLTALAFTLLGSGSGYALMLGLVIITMVPFNSSVPVLDSVATALAHNTGGDYGRIRMWGSISFMAANIAFGAIIAATSAEAVYWGMLISCWLATAVVYLSPSMSAGEPAAKSAPGQPAPRVIDLFRDRTMAAGLIASAAIQGAHAMLYSFGSIYWQSLGFSGSAVGTFWAVGVVSEILMFAVSGRVFGRTGPGAMIAIAGAAAAFRWLAFPYASTAVAVLLLQVLHSLTFACCHLALMRLIIIRVPNRAAGTAQGLYTTVNGTSMALVTLISGPIYRQFGGPGFALMALLCIAGVAIAVVGIGLGEVDQPQSAGRGGRTSEPS